MNMHTQTRRDVSEPSPTPQSFTTPAGLRVRCRQRVVDRAEHLRTLTAALDDRRGLLLSSACEVPGRYRRYDIGFVDPPLCLTARGRGFELRALSERGMPMLRACARQLRAAPEVSLTGRGRTHLSGEVPEGALDGSEEARTRRPTVMSVVRRIVEGFSSPGQPHFGLYGAFGYDLALQFDELRRRRPRAPDQRDLVLYLPDRLLVCDLQRGQSRELSFECSFRASDDDAAEGDFAEGDYRPSDFPDPHAPAAIETATEPAPTLACDHPEGAYQALVRRAHAAFAAGELFEVTPGMTYSAPCSERPSQLFVRLSTENPAPFSFLANLGEGEHLVGVSPEMFVRVTDGRVETCPIAGTIARGQDPLQDAEQVLSLLSSDKAVAELTMCTDVDRNDKARVCAPGSVRVIGRRQIELYSRLIHTVDHVVGELREGYDAIDAFITHCWAVTVTGAPKQAAMQFIEDHERSPRRYYAGAVGFVGFDGSLDTGLTIRCMRIADGRAEVRAGATLLFASDPDEEARECALKASALLSALGAEPPRPAHASQISGGEARGPRLRRVLLVDHRDSFVHMLGDYFRQAGAEVTTLRAGFEPSRLDDLSPELVVLSPGPGRPGDFDTGRTLSLSLSRGAEVFGVCLGLQAVVEHFGGSLGRLPVPRHGVRSSVRASPRPLFAGLPETFEVGRYHSLFGHEHDLPDCLEVTARAEDDGCPMAVAHRTQPIAAVQFHPESIMAAGGGQGARLVRNVLS